MKIVETYSIIMYLSIHLTMIISFFFSYLFLFLLALHDTEYRCTIPNTTYTI